MILVTGATGVLGQALISELQRGTEPFRAIARSEVDLRDRERVLATFRAISPRVVFHLAARVHGLMGNHRFPAEMYTDNIRINTNVIEAAHLSRCEKVVAVSTVSIYPSSATMPIKESAVWDGPPHGAEASYGHAKRAMLAQLEACNSQYGLEFAYAILTNIYGPHDRFDPINGHVVPSLIAKFHAAAKARTGVEVWGSGNPERDFLFSKDAARALLLIAEKHSGTVNVATGKAVKIRDLVETLQRVTKVEGVEWNTSKPDGQLKRSYDVSRLHWLGFEQRYSLEEGLKDTYDWYENAYPAVRS